MAIKHLSSISLEQNELQNAVIHSLGTAPTSPVQGQVYYNSGASKTVFVYTKASGAYDAAYWKALAPGDITSITTATANQLQITNGSEGDTVLDIITAAVANNGTALATGDQIHDFVTAGTLTLTNKTIDADNNTISNLEVDNFKASAIVIESEGIGSNDNDTTVPTSAAVKDYVDAQVDTVDTLSEVLANGNTTGSTNIVVQKSIQLPTTTTNTGTPTDVGVISFGGTYTNGNRIFNDTSGGTLRIQASSNLHLQPSNLRVSNSNGDLIQAGDTGVRLYYQNSQKFTTTTNGVTITGSLTLDSVSISAVQTSGESFVDNDTSIMTSAAIDDRINAAITAEDLDIAGDSGTIAIDLDSETLTIQGTSNEIVTSASGNVLTVGLPDDVTIASQLVVGSASSTDTPTIKAISASTSANILLEGKDTSSASAPDLVLYRNAGAPVDNDTLGVVEFRGRNAMGSADSADLSYGGIYARVVDASDQESALTFSINKGNGSGAYGSAMNIMSIGANNSISGAVVINPASDLSIPTHNLDVNGTANISGNTELGANLTVAGDLTVSGSTTTVDTTNLKVKDALIGLQDGHTAGNTNDIGIIFERGSTGDNAVFVCDESEDKFALGTTTATAASTGFLTVTKGNLIADLTGNADTATKWATARTVTFTNDVTGSFSIDGSGNVSSSLSLAIAVDNYVGWNLKVNGANTTGGASVASGETVDFTNTTGNGGITVSNPGTNEVQFTALGATTTRAGGIEIATQAETETGTDNTRAVTPKTLKDGILSKRFFKDTVGNGSLTTITVTHNFGTKFVIVQCADNGTNGTDPGETVLVDTERDTNNTVKLYFASAPAANSIDVMIVNCNI